MIVVGYSTYFMGSLEIELKEPYLYVLQSYISKTFSMSDVIIVQEHSLRVNDEWKDSGLMQNVVWFIEKYGTLHSGSIRCDGEDSKDVWAIEIVDGKPVVQEIGTSITLNRAEREGVEGLTERFQQEIESMLA